MIHILRKGTILVTMAAILAPSLCAHGSIFKPPKGDNNPGTGYRGPSDVNRGYPTTPGPDGQAPTRPRSADAPAGVGAGLPGAAPSVPGPASIAAADLLGMNSWAWWWEFNKEPFLELRRHLRQAPTLTGSDGFYLGRGERRPSDQALARMDPELVRNDVIPALLEGLTAAPSNDVVTACLVALAKIGNDQDEGLRRHLAMVLQAHLANDNQEVSETAAVALGILGNAESAFLLADIAADTEPGRRAVGARRVPLRTRVFATYGLGLLGHRSANEDVRRFVVHKLSLVLSEDDTRSRDLAIACVLSLGRVPLAWSSGDETPAARRTLVAASRETQVASLLGILRQPRGDHFVRAHAATSIGSVLAADLPEAGEALLEEVALELTKRLGNVSSEPVEVRQSAAIALGLLGDADEDKRDASARGALLAAARADRDGTVRNFARIALARVAARPGKGPDPDAVLEVRRFLLRDLAAGAVATRNWTALALGIHERFRSAGRGAEVAVVDALKTGLREASSSDTKGAFSIANGILGDIAPEALLRGIVERGGEDAVRGHAAVGLGLIDARGSLYALRDIARHASFHPDLLRELAIALGLLGDAEFSAILVEQLGEAKSLASQASIARSLGRIGAADSIAPLISLLGSTEKVDLARAFAAVALGEVADADALPWNTVLSVDTNYLAAPPTLFDLQGFGILNIL